METRTRWGWVAVLGCMVCLTSPALGAKTTKVEGLLEYRKQGFIVVDGQRIQPAAKMKFKGTGSAKKFDTIPAGWEIRAEGTRQADGTILATKMDARPNGSAMFEGEVLQATNQAEQSFVKAGKIADQGADGKEQVIGELKTTGPEVDRARRIVDRLLPTYVDRKNVRVYVVENKEWNAMAMANYSIYVFSGIMKIWMTTSWPWFSATRSPTPRTSTAASRRRRVCTARSGARPPRSACLRWEMGS